jgi:hypothetical protein
MDSRSLSKWPQNLRFAECYAPVGKIAIYNADKDIDNWQ